MPIDPYAIYRSSDLQGRMIDTLIGGIGKGIVADGEVNHVETEALLLWLAENASNGLDHPLASPLLDYVDEMLEDGMLDPDEPEERHEFQQRFSGSMSEWGELSQPSPLPFDNTTPPIVFVGLGFGRKIEKATEYRERYGGRPQIISGSLQAESLEATPLVPICS